MLFGEKCKMRDAKLHGNVTGHNGNPHCQLDLVWNHVGFTPQAVSVRVEYLQSALTEDRRLTLSVDGTTA